MGNVTGKVYYKTEGQNYAEGVVPHQEGLGTFEKINFKVTAVEGKGFTQETFTCNGNQVKRIRWKLYNVTKDITVDMEECSDEKWITDDWRGDVIRAMPKLGCETLEHVEFYINTYYT